jgi:hypothetical protein
MHYFDVLRPFKGKIHMLFASVLPVDVFALGPVLSVSVQYCLRGMVDVQL